MDDQKTVKMKTVAARGQRLMRGGAALRAFAVLGFTTAMALLTVGCLSAANLTGIGGIWPSASLTHAEVVGYDGEVLTVRADLVNDQWYDGVEVYIHPACVESIHSDPCYERGSYDAESARIISGRYDFIWSVLINEGVTAEGGHFALFLQWRCSVKDAVLEGCLGRYSGPPRYDPPGFKRLPEPLGRLDVDFDFAELWSNRWRAEIMLGDAVQVLFRFRIPGLMPGEKVKFHYADDEHSIELEAG